MPYTIPKIFAPKGFQFKISIEKEDNKVISVRIFLFKNNVIIPAGYVELEKYRDSFMPHPYLEPKYRKQGLGILLYAKAIQWCLSNGCKVQSTGYTSRKAQRVWNSKRLNKLFLIKKKVYKKDNMTVWYAYSKV